MLALLCAVLPQPLISTQNPVSRRENDEIQPRALQHKEALHMCGMDL